MATEGGEDRWHKVGQMINWSQIIRKKEKSWLISDKNMPKDEKFIISNQLKVHINMKVMDTSFVIPEHSIQTSKGRTKPTVLPILLLRVCYGCRNNRQCCKYCGQGKGH